MAVCELWSNISDLVQAYDKKRRTTSQCDVRVTEGTFGSGSRPWYTTSETDEASTPNATQNDMPTLNTESTLCDGNGVIQDIYDGIQDYKSRTGAQTDPSFPDPGAPGADECPYDSDYITELQEHVEHLTRTTVSGCPEYEIITPDFHTTVVGSTLFFNDPHQVSVKNANFLRVWQRRFFDPPGEWRWAAFHPVVNFALDADNFAIREQLVTVLPRLQGEWEQWFFEIGNDNCTVCTPVQHHTFYIPPPFNTPRPTEIFVRNDASAYSPYDSGEFDFPDQGGVVTFEGSTNTAADEVKIIISGTDTVGQPFEQIITTGVILGVFQVQATVPAGVNYTGQVIATSPDNNLGSGFTSRIEVVSR